MTKTHKKYDILYHGTDLKGAERIETIGFPGRLLNEHAGPIYTVFLTDNIYKAKSWGEILIEVSLRGVETHYFFDGDGWFFYALADELNARSSWRVIDNELK